VSGIDGEDSVMVLEFKDWLGINLEVGRTKAGDAERLVITCTSAVNDEKQATALEAMSGSLRGFADRLRNLED